MHAREIKRETYRGVLLCFLEAFLFFMFRLLCVIWYVICFCVSVTEILWYCVCIALFSELFKQCLRVIDRCLSDIIDSSFVFFFQKWDYVCICILQCLREIDRWLSDINDSSSVFSIKMRLRLYLYFCYSVCTSLMIVIISTSFDTI